MKKTIIWILAIIALLALVYYMKQYGWFDFLGIKGNACHNAKGVEVWMQDGYIYKYGSCQPSVIEKDLPANA